jgi:hypothetical protein
MFRRTKAQTEVLHPWGITSPLGSQISLLAVKLKAGLWEKDVPFL